MPSRDGRQQYPFQMRDGDAGLFLITALQELGYKYAGPIFNFPLPGPELIEVDNSDWGRGDVIVVSTRPPMNDWEVPERRSSRPSNTTMEAKLFQALKKYIKWCTRAEIVLSAEAAATSPEVAKRASIEFRQHLGSTYKSYGSPETREFKKFQLRDALTAVFLVYVEEAWPGGPGVLAAFGMGGTETLVWCHRLATEYPHLLCTTPFVMAEMRIGDLPERPQTMEFANSWEITILGPTQQPLSETG
jgi:hypothetical protein